MTKVMLVGAMGLVGRAVVDAATAPLLLLARRDEPTLAPRHRLLVAPTGQWPELIGEEKPDVLISCLGTTRRTAGSNEAFAAVDRDLVLTVARAARQAGTRHMISISSVGAHAKSASFYLRVKGEAEDGLRATGFDRLDILRPGLLRGNRAEHRPGESFALMLAPLTDSLLPDRWSKYRSIAAGTVADAIMALVATGGSGDFVHENNAIAALAG